MSESTDTPNPEQVQIREILLKAAVLVEQKVLLQQKTDALISQIELMHANKDKYSTLQLKLSNHMYFGATARHPTILKSNIIRYFRENPKEAIGKALVSNSGICFSDESPRIGRKKAREYLEKDFIPVDIYAKALKATLGLTATWVTRLTFLNRLRDAYPSYFAINENGHLVYMGPLAAINKP